jgi:hypothetical protein
MYQGWLGEWRYRLAYTADPGEGAYIFLFYLALGHLARSLSISIPTMFHIARLGGVIFLLGTMWQYFGELFETYRPRKVAFSLAAIGSGLGWLTLFAGQLTSDFWVAEAYPFLASSVNPHFPISLSLMLWLLMPPFDQSLSWKRIIWYAIGGGLLSIISPFGLIVVIVVLGGSLGRFILQKNWSWSLFWRIFWIVLPGLPLMIYYLWVAKVDPFFAGWSAQNTTPSPPIWDLLISISPAIFVAAIGVWGLFLKQNQEPLLHIGSNQRCLQLVVWAILGLLLMYLPWSLQRRFMMGFYIPLAGLAAIGLEFIALSKPRMVRPLIIVIFILAIPTNLLILLAGFQAAQQQDPKIYISSSEYQAFSWIEENTNQDSIVLSSPPIGLILPAHTGRQVIYGHPLETVNAGTEEQAVNEFFSGAFSTESIEEFVTNRQIDYVFIGSREIELGFDQTPDSWQVVFRAGDVVIYKP